MPRRTNVEPISTQPVEVSFDAQVTNVDRSSVGHVMPSSEAVIRAVQSVVIESSGRPTVVFAVQMPRM
jgi:hypothetical protein